MTEIEDVERARAAIEAEAEHEAQALEVRIQGCMLLAALVAAAAALWLSALWTA